MFFPTRILAVKAENCLKSCSAEEYSEIMKEMVRNPNSIFINNFSADAVSFISILNIITAYASRFPEQFLNEELPQGTECILSAAVQTAILRDDPASFTLLKKAILNDLHNRYVSEGGDFKEAISIAAIKRRTDCLRYCMDNIENISMLISPELLFYLYDNEMTDIIDILLTGRSKEEIAAIFIDRGLVYGLNYTEFKRTVVEYIYETAVRYIPDIRDSDNIPAAVSDFIYFIDSDSAARSIIKSRIFTFYCQINDVKAELSAMKQLGLYFTDITELIFFLNRMSFSNEDLDLIEIFTEYFLPVIKDKCYFRLFYCITGFNCDPDIRNALFQLFDLIGKEHIFFDIRDRVLKISYDNICEVLLKNNRKHTPQFFRKLLSSGIKFITDDDLSEGCAADIITQIPLLLSTMLEQNTFSSEQINVLISTASSKRRTEALNVINKYIIASRN